MTIYYETARNGLIPCEFLGYAKSPAHDVTGCFNVVVRLKRAESGVMPGYVAGEVLHVPHRAIVEKAGRLQYHQLVRTAALPPRTAENTRDARGV